MFQVKWSRENYHHDLATPYTLRLASGDHAGRIIVWDVAHASIRAEFSDGSKPVAGQEPRQTLTFGFVWTDLGPMVFQNSMKYRRILEVPFPCCADLEWISAQDASHDLLVALHPPYSIILWNAATGTKLWKKSYTEVMLGFSFDPFDPTRLACE